MRVSPFIIAVFIIGFAFKAQAQISDELSSSMPDQWQLTLDGIKAQAQSLVIENNGLQIEYRQTVEQLQQLQQAIAQQQRQNDQTAAFLKERRGRTDQQIQLDELMAMVRGKRQQAQSDERQLARMQRQRPPVIPLPTGEDLGRWRKQLEDETTQEVLLENQLKALKAGDKAQNLNVDAVEAQNRDLEARLDMLRLQKLQHETGASSQASQAATADSRRYEDLKRRKEDLEAKISSYAWRMDQLKQSSLTALSWPMKKKKMVHEMVVLDERNNQMRSKIKILKEDIDVLRDQVARLERRINFVQGKDAAQ